MLQFFNYINWFIDF